MKHYMFKTLIALSLLLFGTYRISAQNTSSNEMMLNFSTAIPDQWPAYLLVHKSDFGNYQNSINTIKNVDKIHHYQVKLKEPNFYKIIAFWQNKKRSTISFWALPGSYDLYFDKDKKLTIINNKIESGLELAKLDSQLLAFRKRADSLIGKINYTGRKIEDVENQIHHVRDSIETAFDRNQLYPAILQRKLPLLSAYALYQYAERPIEFPRRKFQPDTILGLLNKLPATASNLPSSITLKDKLKLSKTLSPGNLLKDVYLTDTIGHQAKISDFKGSYLLVDFWASWCVYCRQAHPEHIRLLQKYKEKGFQIISITLDDLESMPSWKKAISDDQIGIWPQYSDFEKKAITTYDVKLIPANFLLDKQGKIIGRDLRGSDLSKQLMDLFGF